MEQVVFQNSRNQNLVGHFYSAKSDAVIIMCHGFTGDKSEWGKFDRLAESFNNNGFNVLTFDLSGSGESDDDSLTVDKHVDDLRSAIKFVRSKGLERIGLYGHSLGGLLSFKCYDSSIATIVTTAPVTDKVKYTWDKKYTAEQLAELNEKGYIAKIRDKGIRRKFIIDKQMLVDRESVNQKELLENVTCPTLIIHGTEDTHVPLSDSKEAIKLLSHESRLEILNGADHGFNDEYLDSVIQLSSNWFKKYLI